MDNILQFFRSILTNLSKDVESLLTLDSLISGITIYLLVVWLACIIWVIKDITSRSRNILIQVLSILLVIFFTPLFGLPIYLLIRPKTTLFEQFYEENSLSELTTKSSQICSSCGEVNSAKAKYCNACGSSLNLACKHCSTPLVDTASYCYHCGKSTAGETIVKPSKVFTKKVKKVQEGTEVLEIQ